MLSAGAVRRNFEQSVEVLTLEAENADGFDIAQFALAHGESGGRNLDGIVRRALAATESFEEVPGFPAAAAAQFGNGHITRQLGNDIGGMGIQHALFGTPEEIHSELAALSDAGVEYVLLTVLGGKGQLRRFAKEVMPAFSGTRSGP